MMVKSQLLDFLPLDTEKITWSFAPEEKGSFMERRPPFPGLIECLTPKAPFGVFSASSGNCSEWS
jgi:hypothetical protein